jgi:cellulose synthase/poly-beta-1,6-N-acetylglucosamine synthase-like glycosyltransferase
MTSLAFELARTVLGWLFVTYTVVAVSHYLFQLVYAHRTYRLQRSAEFAETYPDGTMDVDVIVPTYNEVPALLEACVRSAFAQVHAGQVRVIVVDDGSPNRASLDATYDRLEADGAVVIRSPRNIGKRHAQALALPHCRGDIVVTVDSDTVLAPDAIRRLTRQFRDPRVGAATGFVDVLNHRRNPLTRLQRIRYWMAFKQERAAQSWFRTVLCCSGPLAAYRRSVMMDVAPAYLSQYYGGVACTFGDDRHLTNLVLGAGYDTVFDAGAVAYTIVPENLRQFLKQQLRWSKSFYRELVWTMPFIGNRPWYSRFDLACLVAMPMMLTLTAAVALLLGLAVSPVYLLHYAGFITLAAALRITYAVVRERDLRMYYFVVYGFVSAFLLLSVRFVALSTLTDVRWGTRGSIGAGTSGSLARLRSVLQPASLAVAEASAGFASRPFEPQASEGLPRFDGAWRAGARVKMMAHPASPALGSDRRTVAEAIPTGARAGESPDPTLHPRCAHAIRAGARFCRACGAPYALASEWPNPARADVPVHVASPATAGSTEERPGQPDSKSREAAIDSPSSPGPLPSVAPTSSASVPAARPRVQKPKTTRPAAGARTAAHPRRRRQASTKSDGTAPD